MIKPEDLANPQPKNPSNEDINFENELTIAENLAYEEFRLSKLAGNNPKRVKIKIDGGWSSSRIAKAVEDYKKEGWANANYNYIDECPGSREPMGYWQITLKLPD